MVPVELSGICPGLTFRSLWVRSSICRLGFPKRESPSPWGWQSATLMRINDHFSAVSCCPGNFLNAGTFNRATLLIEKSYWRLFKRIAGICDGRAPSHIISRQCIFHIASYSRCEINLEAWFKKKKSLYLDEWGFQ